MFQALSKLIDSRSDGQGDGLPRGGQEASVIVVDLTHHHGGGAGELAHQECNKEEAEAKARDQL